MKKVHETMNDIISRRLTDIALQIKSNNLYGIKERKCFLKIEINLAEEIASHQSIVFCRLLKSDLTNTKITFMKKMKHRDEKLLAAPIVDEIDDLIKKLKALVTTVPEKKFLEPADHESFDELGMS